MCLLLICLLGSVMMPNAKWFGSKHANA
jgi:hypothetical protein